MSEIWLICGGGTGGHLAPGIAIAEELRGRCSSNQIVFLTSPRDVDRRMIAQAGFPQIPLPFRGLSVRRPFRTALCLVKSVRIARRSIRSIRPRAVIGLGGFASVPGILAAYRRVPILLLEQNVIPGRATRGLARCADHICTAFPETRDLLPASARRRAVVTGNPIRQKFADIPPGCGPWTLLVLGGSGGSNSVNNLGLECVRELSTTALSGWSVLHQTGEGDENRIRKEYRSLGVTAEVRAFVNDIDDWIRRATVVLTRAGGTTLAELAASGRPTVAIPLPNAKDDHQTVNAGWFADRSAMLQVAESAGAASVVEAVRSLAGNPRYREEIGARLQSFSRADAARTVVDLARSLNPGSV